MYWKKMTDFEPKLKSFEKWIYNDTNVEKSFDVKVEFSKPIDILKLKDKMTTNFKYEVEKIKKSRVGLYSNSRFKIDRCPICNTNSNNKELLEIYKAEYVQCDNCKHCYIINRPSKEHLDEYYSKSAQYQSTYADKESLITRVNEVAIPKLSYVISEYERIYKKKPKSILDVGAGSGHFVYACRSMGLEADGIEISSTGRKFCEENFQIKLLNKDFMDSYNEFKNYDIITFWGVIEHVPNPVGMLNRARKVCNDDKSLIVAEVPRWESLSTSVQTLMPTNITRHLDPLGHINLFTDTSLATAFVKSGINITSAWYFGMDIYELFNQIADITNGKEMLKDLKYLIPKLQASIDKSRLSDGIVLTGIPSKG